MKIVGKLGSALVAIAFSAMAFGASATSISWQTNTYSGSCAVGYTCNSTQRSFLGSDGTTLVTAEAWAFNTNTLAIETAQLGFYSNGLGVTNNGNDGSHTVDNDGYTDMVAFYFSEEVDLKSIFLSTYGDTDFSAWIGTVPGIPDFTGLDFADLDTNYGGHFDNYGGNVDRLAEFGSFEESGNLLVVAALQPANGISDLFKIKALYASAIVTEPDDPTVSTPSTMLVFGPTVFGLAWYRRRRMQKQAADEAAVEDGTEES